MKTRLLLKLALLGGALALLQLVFGAATNYKDTPTPVRLCDQYLAERRDIIYFGESTVFTVDPEDKNKSPIDDMLQQLLPEYRLGSIAHDAFHLQLYEDFCTYIARKPYHPRLLIVPVNLATVSPYWDDRPEYQFERIALFLRHDTWWFRAFYRPLAAFGAFNLNPVSQKAFDNVIVYDEGRPVGRMKDFTDDRYMNVTEENMRDQLIVRYMHQITPEDLKMQALCRIADIPPHTDMEVLFYVTPVDYETGDKYLGARFSAHIRESVRLVKRLLAEKGITPLDLSLDLSADKFHWGSRYPNEHLNERGRRYVAEQLAAAVRQRLGPPS